MMATAAVAATADPAATLVPRWQPHDFDFHSDRMPQNPFQAAFSVEASGPGGLKLIVPGFYDGGGTWKARVSPTAEGEWSLLTHADLPGLDQQRASFRCGQNTSLKVHGGLRVDPQHPHHFIFEDGSRFFLMGYECDWLWALDMKDPALGTVNRFLDKLAASGFNYILLNAFAYDTTWRKGNTGADDFGPPPLYPWAGDNAAPDHSRFNLPYWRHYDQVIAAMNERGILAHIMIKVYNKGVKWPALRSREDDQYFRWIIARYAAYPNVHWDFSKESNNEKDTAYKLGRIQFIRENDPYRRPITTHTDLSAFDRGAYNQVLDFRSDQVHTNWHAALIEHRRQQAWPVLNVEFGYEHGPGGLNDKTYNVAQAPEEVCRRAWEVYLAGGYGAYYYTYTAWDVIRPDDTPPGYAYFRHLRDFFEGTAYWRLEPSDALVSAGYCLADPGREYVVFLNRAEPFSLRLDGLPSPLPARWYQPFTGKWQEAGTLAAGSAQLQPPADWPAAPVVLHVGKRATE
ncbi:MAG TPA: DUF4038 domain-containing protein [Candidatus Acidoferrum sp.]|nr:DUF4038 domain-containing protein [Candidatus Acidoferrum sp.]